MWMECTWILHQKLAVEPSGNSQVKIVIGTSQISHQNFVNLKIILLNNFSMNYFISDFVKSDNDGSRSYVVIGDMERTHLTVVLPTGISVQATTVENTVTFALALPSKYMVTIASFHYLHLKRIVRFSCIS